MPTTQPSLKQLQGESWTVSKELYVNVVEAKCVQNRIRQLHFQLSAPE